MKNLLLTCLLLVAATVISAQCTASFTWDDTDITIQFMDTSTSDPGDPIVSWFWDFDDNGNTSTLQNPSYTFSDPDDYDVVLMITTQSGCTSSIEIEIETCVLDVRHTIGTCDANGNIPVDITINDPWDVADEVDVILDGQSVPGSPFDIDAATPVNITVDVPGDGLTHVIQCQSVDIATCGKTIDFTVPDCNSNCFLSGLQVGYPVGATHTVDVGDDFFSPVSVGIDLGDIVHFNWIGDGHSTTSDATSGPDAWNSGVISIGSTFDVSIDNPGVHPYYCIPHGGTGGVGMSGEILANCPTGNSLDLIVSFNTSIADPAGYNIYYDSALIAGSPFAYSGTGGQSQTISIAGDGMVHPLLIEDVNDSTCILSINYSAPDCNQGGGDPICSIGVNLGQPSGCDANQDVMVDATVTIANGGPGFNLTVDGGAPTFYPYAGPSTTVTVTIPGDGQIHTIAVTDDVDGTCIDSAQITSPDCNLPCNISNLMVAEAGAGGGTTHTVDVEDFIFNPSDINITTGDVIEWVWTGAVAHTTTSDATSGTDSWDSGLLNTGDTYTSPILSQGTHPYYCIPHGSSGGVGMAGTIFVLPPCNANGEVIVNVNFDITSNGTSGYEVLVDGTVAGTFSYVGGAVQSASVNVIGDGLSHTIEVRDIDDNTCSASANLTTVDCGGTAMCSISATSTVSGGCDANNQVPVDLVVTASDQGSNFTVTVDGTPQGTFPYTGSTTNITIDVDGDGQNHAIILTDDVDPDCTASTTVNTPNCASGCAINAIDITFGENTTHVIQVEDFEFIPAAINITLGDTILFDWTGNIPHTATSDSPTGSDAFDSGLLSNGATYQFIPGSIGDHPYYCIPHGAPGGIGMAGNINVSPACNGDQALAAISVSADGSSGLGFTLVLDGTILPESPLNFNPSGPSTATILVPGDDMDHTLVVADVSDPSCENSIGFTSPLCIVDSCLTMISNVGFGPCNGATVEMTIDFTSLAGDQEHNVFLNGVQLNSLPIATDAQGVGSYGTEIAGLGSDVQLVVTNILDNTCADTLITTTPDCAVPCLMSDVTVGGKGVHQVEVRDFDFFPKDIAVLVGDTVRFVWTGVVPHTTTSDATSGPDSWDSGLFGEGHVFDLVVQSDGFHPYYCIPHGGPGGIGMAGSITAIDTCDGDEWLTPYSFTVSAGSPLGYNVFVDGAQWNNTPIPYQDPKGINTGIIRLPGDEMTHLITLQDMETDFCAFTRSVTTGLCGAGCTIEDLSADVDASVIHEVEVRDFDFLPVDITVRVGETVRFIWTGDIPHTSTSDATSGPDSWDSGLLSKGDTFDIIIQTPGSHPYYCIPHGGPGGIGQSGVIHALPACEDGNQEVSISFVANGGSAQGYKLFIDGNIIGGLRPYDNADGTNQLSLLLPADGLEHIVTIQDDENPICAASAFYNSIDCATDCEVSDLTYELISNSHTVLVRDFDYLPLDLTVEAGDTIVFEWVGDIPHTVTSDAIDGASVFNSGLLSKGDQWILILDEVGSHPYYCIPHGGPGGVGMAGNITVVDPCDDEEVLSLFSFTTSRLSGSYDVFLNGAVVLSDQPYSGTPENTFTVALPADNSAIEITVVDQQLENCTTSRNINGINCGDPCFDIMADFEFNINFATMEVEFTDQSSGSVTAWSWDFGDGATSTEANPSHTYADPIVYEVCLTVEDDAGCTSTFCDKVRFSDQVCIAGFTYEQDDLNFTFTNTSDYEDPNTEILWTFGDGSISSETDTTSHAYDLGTYTVCIQISSDSCETSYCEVIDLSDPCLVISPDFEAVKDDENLTVQFNDLTSGDPDSWLWGFGDGTTSTEQNPTHTFATMGEYNICLFVQEEDNGCSKSYCRKISVGTTSVIELEAYHTLRVYPNPSLQNTANTIEGFDTADLGSDAQLTIWTAHGQQVNTDQVTLTDKYTLQFESRPGVYIIQLDTDNRRYRAMIVKQ